MPAIRTTRSCRGGVIARAKAASLVSMLLSVASPSLLAQQITGVVWRPDSSAVASGTLVELRRREGEPERVLTDGRGRFRLVVAAGDTVRLRLLRPGMQPHDVGPLVLAPAETRALTIVLHARPVALPAVTVRDRPVCGPESRAESAAWRLWEQAQSALHAVVLAAGDSALTVRTVAYQGEATGDGDVIVLDSLTRLHQGAVERDASHYDRLFARGLVEGAGRAALFHGPDATYFADDRFALSQCFRLVHDRIGPRPGLVGVRFEPNRRARGTTVSGTVWLDSTRFLPVSLEFAYENLPREHRVEGLGGYATFEGLPSGHWLLSAWQVRVPWTRRWYGPLERLTDRDGEWIRRRDGRGEYEEGYRVGAELLRWAQGGRVLSVSWDGVPLYEDVVAAQLLDRARRRR